MDFSASTTAALASGHFGSALLFALLGGFLTSLSPCVYPLIPITLSVFGARDPNQRGKNLSLALAYALGMVLLYAALGTAFASAGKVFGTLLASTGFVVGFSVFSFVMAASMFGAFELALPASVQTKLSLLGGEGYVGAFVMGLVSGLVAAPCTGPVLTVLLTYVAQQHDLGFGFVLMSAFASGLALPFVVLATFSSLLSRLPKSGAWMDTVKALLGAAMVGLGLYYLQLAVPLLRRAAAWQEVGAAFLVFTLTVLLVRGKRIKHGFRVGLALVLAVSGFSLLGARGTSHAPLQWRHDLDAALSEAKQRGKPVMIDFYATWCAACVELDEKTFSQPEVQRALGSFVTVKVDGTEETDAITELYQRFSVKGLPTVAFISPEGNLLEQPRVTGFVGPTEFVPLLSNVGPSDSWRAQ